MILSSNQKKNNNNRPWQKWQDEKPKKKSTSISFCIINFFSKKKKKTLDTPFVANGLAQLKRLTKFTKPTNVNQSLVRNNTEILEGWTKMWHPYDCIFFFMSFNRIIIFIMYIFFPISHSYKEISRIFANILTVYLSLYLYLSVPKVYRLRTYFPIHCNRSPDK